MKKYLQTVFSWLVILALLLVALPAPSAQALSPDIVISQVYGGGGNTGALYKNDFIELFNRGTTAVSFSGWSVQYGSSGGTSWSNKTDLPAVSLAPGQYYLIQEAAGSGGSENLPTPDAIGTIAMSATNGKIALVNNQTLLTGSGCPFDASVVDFVGYGTANCFEGGSAAPALSNTTAALRASNGCTETDVNSADFAAGAPTPRNTASPFFLCSGDNPPSVSSTIPANGATSVELDADISIEFSEPVDVADPWFSISCATSGDHSAAVSGGPETFSLNPDADFVTGETCTVTIFASQVTDQDGTPDPMAADYVFSFSTFGPRTFIHDIQGAGHLSPLNGTLVTNVNGIVTALRSNGFYLQDPNPDADETTSEGIFVFTGSAPTVVPGDGVRVGGTVQEFRPGGTSSDNLTTTELGSPGLVVTRLSGGNLLPAAIILGAGGRVPPATVIEDDATGDVENSGVFDSASDGIDFYESLEGMLVQVNDAVVTGPRRDFGSNREIPVVGDNGANAGERTPRGGVVIQEGDFNPERIVLNDLISGGPILPSANVGDSFPGAIVGAIDYNFGNFKLEVTTLPELVSGGLAQEVTTPADNEHLSAATFNVENLSPNDDQAKFDTLAELIVSHLQSPDILAIEEIQDNNGTTNDSTVDASVTWSLLIAAIQSAGGPTYQYAQIDPVDDQDGGAPGGNIRQGFLYRTDRGLSFIERAGAGSTTPNAVVGSGLDTRLQYSPGRIDPENTAFDDSRKPLAGEFMFNGRHLFVIANHFNSKSGDDPLFGHWQPPVFSSEAQRLQQAQIEHDFVQQILTADPNADVIVLGDLNDFQFSDPIKTLTGEINGEVILNDLINSLPVAERYTYVFDGNSEVLDHTLLSNNLNETHFLYDVVHVNSEFWDQASDHEPQVVQLLTYQFSGFFEPVNNPPTLNIMKAGQAIPVKFSLNGDKGLEILAEGYPQSVSIACDLSEPRDQIEETVRAGESSLEYDPATDTYTYVWKTDKSWAGTCRQLIVKLDDGTFHYANFRFR